MGTLVKRLIPQTLTHELIYPGPKANLTNY